MQSGRTPLAAVTALLVLTCGLETRGRRLEDLAEADTSIAS